MKKNIKIKDVDCLAFAGPGDQNIKVIEKLFDSDIVLRGNELLVNGTIVKTGCSDLAQELEKDGYEGVAKTKWT